MRILWIGMTLVMLLSLPALAADITGTWKFSVDLEDGGHGDPTFVFEQKDDKLTGTYNGPLGEHKVTGVVTGDTAQFAFSFEQEGETMKVTYTAKIESATKMSGTIRLEAGDEGGSGKWTAVKQ
jgi:hypothetical protein